MTFKDGSRSSTQTVCDRCLHFWCCYKRTRPLARFLPNCFVQSWQRLEGWPSWYCSTVPFGRLFENRTRWRVFAWCPKSNITITKTWKWTTSLYWWQLSQADRGAVLLHWKWLWLTAEHWRWPWLVCNEPFLLTNQQWPGWNHKFHPSNWLKPAILSQNLSTGFFIDGLAQATIEDHRRPCALPLSSPNTRHSLWYRPWHPFWGLASSIYDR